MVSSIVGDSFVFAPIRPASHRNASSRIDFGGISIHFQAVSYPFMAMIGLASVNDQRLAPVFVPQARFGHRFQLEFRVYPQQHGQTHSGAFPARSRQRSELPRGLAGRGSYTGLSGQNPKKGRNDPRITKLFQAKNESSELSKVFHFLENSSARILLNINLES